MIAESERNGFTSRTDQGREISRRRFFHILPEGSDMNLYFLLRHARLVEHSEYCLYIGTWSYSWQ